MYCTSYANESDLALSAINTFLAEMLLHGYCDRLAINLFEKSLETEIYADEVYREIKTYMVAVLSVIMYLGLFSLKQPFQSSIKSSLE